ncbi:MAG: hypothetical protein Kow0074_23530 [Candidatus Zixiibacteriota bacterium]
MLKKKRHDVACRRDDHAEGRAEHAPLPKHVTRKGLMHAFTPSASDTIFNTPTDREKSDG